MEDTSIEDRVSEPEIIEVDWSEYFDGLQGTAVLYEAKDRRFANLVSGISGRLLIRSDRNKCKKPWRSYLMGTVPCLPVEKRVRWIIERIEGQAFQTEGD